MSNVAIASAVTRSDEKTRKLGHFWGRGLCRACKVDVSVEGGDRVAWDEPLLVMANHQSYFDIPVLYATLPISPSMLAKKELFGIPLFGRAMHAMGCIPIDRSNRRQSFASLRDAALQAQRGLPLVIFPEGTRSMDGRIHDLKKGPFHLAELAGVPVVPVGIRGTHEVLAKDAALVRGGPVHVRIGEPLVLEGRGARAREIMRRRVREALVELSGLPAAEVREGPEGRETEDESASA